MSRKIPGPKINPQKSHAEFPSLKNYQALHCKRYNPKDNNSRERGKKNLCRTTWPGNAGTTTNLHIFLNTPPPPKKNKQTNKQTKTFLPPTWNKPANAKNPGIEKFKPLLQVNARGKLSPRQLRRLVWSHITEFSKWPWTVAYYTALACAIS